MPLWVPRVVQVVFLTRFSLGSGSLRPALRKSGGAPNPGYALGAALGAGLDPNYRTQIQKAPLCRRVAFYR